MSHHARRRPVSQQDIPDGDGIPLLDRYQNAIFGALIVAIVVGAVALVAGRPAPVEFVIIPPAPTSTSPPTATHAPVRVYVSGAVARPDVYTLPWGSIAQDAIALAGGALDSADLTRVNLAHVLRDGDQIYVPAAAGTDVVLATASSIVNINEATQEELDSLPGIGPGLAQRIIDYREANGPFLSVEQVTEVPGIGPSKFEEIKDHIAVE
jgi:competence protein ComEA